MKAEGTTGYWAPDGNGEYYYFASNGTAYRDAYPYEAHRFGASIQTITNIARA